VEFVLHSRDDPSNAQPRPESLFEIDHMLKATISIIALQLGGPIATARWCMVQPGVGAHVADDLGRS